MCGIVGIFRSKGIHPPDNQYLDKAMELMRPRGPDGEGRYESERLLLGHRRLAVLDPEAGAQPWIDKESGAVLVYNGELYNFRELRRDLQHKGHVFTTDCDTEVVMQAFLEWGIACLDRFTGMFALAIHDPGEGALWLARDRLGVKPLYYHHSDALTAFSSSVAGLLVMPDIQLVLDRSALMHYLLTIRTTLGEQTLFRDVATLLPGQYARIDMTTGVMKKTCWWKLPVFAGHEKVTTSRNAEIKQRVRGMLDDAVSGQLVSDVPLGGFLSGGLDSSVLTGSILMNWREDLQACSVGYSRPGYNEWEHVREAAEFHGVHHREVVLQEPDYLEDWRELVAFKGLPLSTPNEVAIMNLARASKSAFTVAMTGEGADEVFGGYIGPTFCAADFDRSIRSPSGISTDAMRRGYGCAGFSSRREHFLMANGWLGLEKQRQHFPCLFADGANAMELVTGYYDSLFDTVSTCTTFDAYLHVHGQVNLEGLLNRLDSSTMVASVEGRVPYTDHKLVEWLFTLPDDLKMRLNPRVNEDQVFDMNVMDLQRNGFVQSKRLLRECFVERVPQSILQRKKVSFPVPFIEWFNGSLKDAYREAVAESVLVKELLSADMLEKLLRQEDACIDGLLAWPLMNLAVLEDKWGATL